VRRGPDLDEPVDLIDDGWAGATEVTRTKERRRWPEALLVVAALAVVVGIGAAGGGDGDDETDMPRTTSTTVRRTTTSTTPRPTTTTTTWPLRVAGTGSVLGPDAAPTGTALVVAEERSVVVLDLDSGDLCRTDGRAGGSWFPPYQGTAPEVELHDNGGRSLVIDRDCDLRPANLDFDGSWVVARTETATWVMEDGPAQQLVEHTPDGGERRRIDVPAFSGSVVDRDWLVIALAGEMVAIDLHGGPDFGLGSGFPLGVGGGRLVATRCERLDCSMVMIDIATGRARTLDLPRPVQWEPAVLSPDARWLTFAVAEEDGNARPVLADLETGRVTDTRGGPCQFTTDSRWLLCVRPSVVEAVDLASGRIVDLTDRFRRPTNGFAVMRV